MIRKLSRFALILTIAPLLSLAQISIGPVITFDPTVALKIATETLKVIKIAAATLSTYEQLKFDAQYVHNKYFWKGFMSNIIYQSIPDQIGETSGWEAQVWKGLQMVNGWQRAAIALQSNPRLIFGSPFTAQYASAEIGSASARGALQVLGTSRIAMMQMQTPIEACQTAALTTDSGMNTTAAQLNVSTACQSLLLRQSQTQLAVSTARLDLELTRTKMEVDNQTDFANMVTSIQNYTATQAIAPADVSAGLMNHMDR